MDNYLTQFYSVLLYFWNYYPVNLVCFKGLPCFLKFIRWICMSAPLCSCCKLSSLALALLFHIYMLYFPVQSFWYLYMACVCENLIQSKVIRYITLPLLSLIYILHRSLYEKLNPYEVAVMLRVDYIYSLFYKSSRWTCKIRLDVALI